MTSEKRKFIIDCDVGTDDAQAILMALAHPDVEVVAITTVFGNSSLEETTENALRVLKVADRLDIPVYKGCERSLLGVGSKRSGYHGDDALGDVVLEGVDPVSATYREEPAAVALCRLVAASPVTLVAIGPLTNVAAALQLDPGLMGRLHECVVMGGNSRGEGNVTMTAEFNTWSDAEAAQCVLAAAGRAGRPLQLVTWDVCRLHACTWEWYDKHVATPTARGRFVRDTERKMVERERGNEKRYVMMWDMLAMAVALETSVATETVDVYCEVELGGALTRGMVVVDWTGRRGLPPNVRLVQGCDQLGFQALLTTAVAPWPATTAT